MDDLVARLRVEQDAGWYCIGEVFKEAADEIERLRAELEAWEEIAEVHLQDAQSLRAENAALREVLQNHNDGCIQSCEARTKADKGCQHYQRIRRLCPDCPRDWMIDDAAIDAARKAS